MLDPHSLDPVKVLELVKTMGGVPGRVLLVGCEPETVGSDEDWDVTPGLSEPVQRAAVEAVLLIESLVREAHESHLALDAELS
jgi:hydrogenase maturation protease